MFISERQGIGTWLLRTAGPAGATAAARASEPVSQHQQLPAQPGCPVPEPAEDGGATGTGPVLVVPSSAQMGLHQCPPGQQMGCLDFSKMLFINV